MFPDGILSLIIRPRIAKVKRIEQFFKHNHLSITPFRCVHSDFIHKRKDISKHNNIHAREIVEELIRYGNPVFC
jgi:hypothetical protein